MKLGAFAPRFLLESVEGGERLARYSFIGFGDGLEVRLDASGFVIGTERRPPPANGAGLLAALRAALAQAPRPQPDIPGVPLAGGLVGFAAYDVVRHFERLPRSAAGAPSVPALHYVAPRSVLVFDHLTRGIALLHAGSEAERRALRAEVVRALRGALPGQRRAGRYTAPTAAYNRDDYLAGVRRTQQYIGAGDVYQLVLASRFAGRHELDPFQAYRALRLVNRGAGEVEWWARAAVAHRRHAAARRGAGHGPGARGGAARRSQGECRARHAGGPGAQRSRARGPCRQRACRPLPLHRALQSRHAHGERGAGRARPGPRCLRSVRGGFSRRHAGGCAEGARHADHRRARAREPRVVRRHGRLLRRARGHGSRPHDS